MLNVSGNALDGIEDLECLTGLTHLTACDNDLTDMKVGTCCTYHTIYNDGHGRKIQYVLLTVVGKENWIKTSGARSKSVGDVLKHWYSFYVCPPQRV